MIPAADLWGRCRSGVARPVVCPPSDTFSIGNVPLKDIRQTPREFAGQLASRATDMLRQQYRVILWTVTTFTVVYLILLPPGGDIIQGIAWADLEALNRPFPGVLSDLFLPRGIGYKVFLWFSESLSRAFAGEALRLRIYLFNAIFIALAVGLLAAAYLAFLRRRNREEMDRRLSLRDGAETIAVAIILFLPATRACWARDTQIAILLCLAGIGLALSSAASAQWCSGAILILLFSIKGVTALDFLFVLAVVMTSGEQKRIRRVIISGAVAGIAAVLIFTTILRSEFRDILLAAQFRQIAGARLFLPNALRFARHNPAVPAALVALAMSVFRSRAVPGPSRKLMVFAILVWLIPLIDVFVQREYFEYHYEEFILSSWLCIASLYLARGGKWQDFFCIQSEPRAKGAVLLACCLGLAMIGLSLRSRSGEYSLPAAERDLSCRLRLAEEVRSLVLNANPGMTEKDRALYLSNWSYGMGFSSALRIFFPVPLQRQNTSTPAAREFVNSILAYEGPAVIAEATISSRPDISRVGQYLRANYQPITIAAPCHTLQIWLRAKR